jgi:hypothetical protein
VSLDSKGESALERSCQAIDAELGESLDDKQRLIAAKAKGLMVGYHARWKDAGYVAFAVEQIIHKNLINPDTQRQSRSFTTAGKLDVLCTYAGRNVLIDHKTTTQDISDPDSPYWRQLVVEGQVNHYMLLAWMDATKIDSAIWDVIRKPGISPKKLTKAERASVVAEGVYFGNDVNQGDRMALSQGEERESAEMYSFRLAHDCTVERPGWYFQRRAVPRLDAEVVEYAAEIWEHSQDMLYSRSKIAAGKLPPRNSGACMLYGSPCNFLGICSGHDTPESDRWQRRESVHPELEGTVGEGKDVLTNSRVRCFQTCRRKEYYQYQLGIERYDEEEKESLYFGTLFHEALRAWWESFLNPKESE